MLVQFLAADGTTIIDSEAVSQSAAEKFLRELEDMHQARTIEIR